MNLCGGRVLGSIIGTRLTKLFIIIMMFRMYLLRVCIYVLIIILRFIQIIRSEISSHENMIHYNIVQLGEKTFFFQNIT